MIVDCVIGLVISLGTGLHLSGARIRLVLRTTKADESAYRGAAKSAAAKKAVDDKLRKESATALGDCALD